MLSDIVGTKDDEDELRDYLAAMFAKQDAEEATWSMETDGDRLDRAFSLMWGKKIIAVQNAGYTMSDGRTVVAEEHESLPESHMKGFCFYHGQDLERGVEEGMLYLAFGALEGGPEDHVAIGRIVRDTLVEHGFTCEWNEKVKKRILVKGIDWKRRRGPGR